MISERAAVLLVLVLVSCGADRAENPPVTAPAPSEQTTTPLPAAPPPASSATVTASPPRAAAAPEPTPAPADSTPAPALTVDRDAWVTQFETALPVALCKPGSYFRACFAVTPVECEQTAASATRVCLNKVKKQLPPKIGQPDEGRAWGTKIGSCAGTSYEVALSSKKIQSQKCSDPSVWTQPP